MGLVIENLLRTTMLDPGERDVCLRGIATVAMADGTVDARERAYLQKFVDEFFPDADPTDEAWSRPLADEDLKLLKSDAVRQSFLGYGYITAYIDESFDPTEAKLLDAWAAQLVSPEVKDQILTAVREFLYRRSVFAYAFRLGRLDEEFAVKASSRFGVPTERVKELNAGVFNAIMTIKNPIQAAADAQAGS
jgi:hypothetical protein